MTNTLKPFDLERALAGDPVVTRSGLPVTDLVRFNTTDRMTFYGVCEKEVLSWTDNGRFYNSTDEVTSGYDLFMVPNKQVRWVNIYIDEDGTGEAYLKDSEAEANRSARDHGRLGNKAHRIEWEE